MKRSLTLLAAAALAYASPLWAQSYTENFEGAQIPVCATLVNSEKTITSTEVINGTGSLFSNPPVNSSSTRDYLSPYLNITSTNLTISFWWKFNQALSNNSTRSIEVGLAGSNGVYYPLNTITINDNTVGQTVKKLHAVNVTAPFTGVFRLVLKMGGGTGSGNIRIIVDDITINANPYYNTVCNAAPVAVNDEYTPISVAAFSDNVITNTVGGSDQEPNGENLSAAIVTQPDPTVGSVVLNADGNFVFTPALGTFRGGPVTFTYRLTDNGYAPASSNTATVTINYPVLITLPVRLISFAGSMITNKAQLKWAVAANETGYHFQILRSNDGKSYQQVGVVSRSAKVGEDQYTYTDTKELTGTTYYKIKIVNKDNSISYSNVVVLKHGAESISALQVLRNPVLSSLDFGYTTPQGNDYNVVIYTTTGIKVWSRKIHMQKGANTVSLSLDGILPTGIFILEVSNGAERQVSKFIKK